MLITEEKKKADWLMFFIGAFLGLLVGVSAMGTLLLTQYCHQTAIPTPIANKTLPDDKNFNSQFLE